MSTPRLVTLALLLLAGCGNKDKDSGAATGTPTGGTSSCATELVGQELPASLYSVWGSSASDVWMVGEDPGTGPLVLHFDGTAWTKVDTGTTGALWWVWGESADSLWFSGRNGRVVHHVPSAGSFDEVTATDELFTLYGLWGSSGGDIWTVGGASDNSGVGVVAHYDGADWTTRTDVPAESGVVFKVWGSSATEVYMVGPGALLMKTDGTDWTVSDNPFANAPDLFTVTGCGDEVYASGGFGNAAVARSTDGGATWTDDSPPVMALAPRFTGIHTSCDHGTVAVGNTGALWRRGDEWAPTCDIPGTLLDFHGTWIDPDGGIWAVGGNLISGTEGIVAYDGPAAIPTISL